MSYGLFPEPDWHWTERGACKDHPAEVFFPVRGQSAAPAKAICGDCPVLEPCREWALDFEQFGVWGGLTEDERRSIRRERKQGRTRRTWRGDIGAG